MMAIWIITVHNHRIELYHETGLISFKVEYLIWSVTFDCFNWAEHYVPFHCQV